MKEKRKLSVFQITAIVLTALLAVAIIVQISVMIVLKNKTEQTKDKNDQIIVETTNENEETLSVINFERFL